MWEQEPVEPDFRFQILTAQALWLRGGVARRGSALLHGIIVSVGLCCKTVDRGVVG